ncbi:MAG: hypothetical protein DI556_04000 [Rhodovulum sulfidophilum]|uniref:Uncharacterized protein n=1 Tax=Rhodovulum sulfidophilum TaxID=35806 RepID=A0A2W5QIJ2_RHOSU|nr:MAG: hypothetical protein DI556_04000 [Rhodovulum sulfidophilum]
MSRRPAFPAPKSGSRSAFATVALGMGAAASSGVAVLMLGGGLIAAIGAYMLTGSAAIAALGVVQAARPLRPRLHRLAARLRRPVAILTH